jgi:hypothetical protein
MKTMLCEDRIDASAMVKYFQPLLTWSKKQKRGEKAGWARRRSYGRD